MLKMRRLLRFIHLRYAPCRSNENGRPEGAAACLILVDENV